MILETTKAVKNIADTAAQFWLYTRNPIKFGKWFCETDYLNQHPYEHSVHNNTEETHKFKVNYEGYCSFFDPSWHEWFTRADNIRLVGFVKRVTDLGLDKFIGKPINPNAITQLIITAPVSYIVSSWESGKENHVQQTINYGNDVANSCNHLTEDAIIRAIYTELDYDYSGHWVLWPEIVTSLVSTFIVPTSAFSLAVFTFTMLPQLPFYTVLDARNEYYLKQRDIVFSQMVENCTDGISFLQEHFDCGKQAFSNASEMIKAILLDTCKAIVPVEELGLQVGIYTPITDHNDYLPTTCRLPDDVYLVGNDIQDNVVS